MKIAPAGVYLTGAKSFEFEVVIQALFSLCGVLFECLAQMCRVVSSDVAL